MTPRHGGSLRKEEGTASESTDIQRAATLFGIVFLGVGILGFIPGITSDYGRLDVFDDVGSKLLGLFGVNVVENVAHLLFGALGLVAARSRAASKSYFVAAGIVYVALWLYGLIIDEASAANFLGLNTAAHWLHLVIGLAMLAVGALPGRRVLRERAVTA